MLMAGVGAFLGPLAVLDVVALSALCGLAALLIALARKKDPNAYFAFGPVVNFLTYIGSLLTRENGTDDQP